MHIGAYLTGRFGQSQALYTARNEEKRGRGSREEVEKQRRKDTKTVLDLQEQVGLDVLCDPLFAQDDIFQSFAEHVPGVQRSFQQENYLNNNVFFKQPHIQGPFLPINAVGFTQKHMYLDLFSKGRKALGILPSPYLLLAYAHVEGYDHKENALIDLSILLKREAEHLVKQGITRIQYDEPVFVHKNDLGSLKEEDKELLARAMLICGKVEGATTILHTYFGNAGPVLPFLLTLPVDGLGIDATETAVRDVVQHSFKEKELVLGLIDARSTAREDPVVLARIARSVAEHCMPKSLWITPNTGTEYWGYTHGVNKLHILAEARRLANE